MGFATDVGTVIGWDMRRLDYQGVVGKAWCDKIDTGNKIAQIAAQLSNLEPDSAEAKRFTGLMKQYQEKEKVHEGRLKFFYQLVGLADTEQKSSDKLASKNIQNTFSLMAQA